MNLDPQLNISPWKKILSLTEAFFPLFCAVILHTLIYTAIGEKVTHNFDYGYIIDSKIDKHIPFFSVFILPYLLTNVYGLAIVIYVIISKVTPYLLFVRRAFFTLVALQIASYLLYFYFPVQYHHRVDLNLLHQGGFLSQLVAYSYTGITSWNESPSFHVSSTWILYRILSFHVKSKLFLALFILIFFSTVFIKIHYIFGSISGLVLAEIIYRAVFKNLEKKQAFLNIKSPHALLFYVCFFSILGYVYYLMTK